jgi:hypothetical protein
VEEGIKPLFFYLMVDVKKDCLVLTANGFGKDFRSFETVIGVLPLN